MVFPGPDSGLALFSILSVFRSEVIHLLSQLGQLDQTLLQVLLQLGYLQLQGQDGLTEHTHTRCRVKQISGGRKRCWYVCLRPVTGAGLQRASALLCIHASAESRLGSVVMPVSLCSVFRTSLLCNEAEGEFLEIQVSYQNSFFQFLKNQLHRAEQLVIIRTKSSFIPKNSSMEQIKTAVN